MASARPRRSLRNMNYKEMLKSDSEESESANSNSDLSDASPERLSTLSDQVLSTSTELVRMPSANDILETQDLIRTKTTELAVVDAEYQILKRKFEAMGERRTAIERVLLDMKAYLARIRALPQEVLGLIFLFYTDDYSQSPWILMQVTRTWRATALSTRAIWAKIMISSPAWQTSGASRRKEGRELCGSQEQLDRAPRRAGNTALHITIALNNPHGGSSIREYDRNTFRSMINLLATSRKCHHLEIKGPCTWSVNWKGDDVPLKFPRVKSLCITSSLFPRDLTQVLEASEGVTDVHFVMPYGRWVGAGYETMTSLSLDASTIRLGMGESYVENVRSALNNAPLITTLKLIGFSLETTNFPQPVLRLPNLQTLVMNARSHIWPFDAPRLTNLTLSDGSFIPAGPPGSNYFALLTSLTVKAASSRNSPPDYLRHLHFPALHTLDLCFGTQKNELVQLMSHQAELNPVVFKLRKTGISTARLTEMIDSMGRLEELQLEDVHIKKDFFAFLGSCKDDAVDELHCPRLVRLRVDLKTGSATQNKIIRPVVKTALQARVRAGIAMEAWCIQCSEDKGWQDFLT